MGMIRLCPKCGERVELADVFCGGCGAKLAKGSSRLGESKFEEQPERFLLALSWFLELFPGLMRPLVVIMSAIALVVGLGVGWLAVYIFALGGLIAAFFIGGFAVVVYWTALCWLMYGEIVLPVEALSEFQSKHWWAFFVLTLGPISVLFWYAKALMAR